MIAWMVRLTGRLAQMVFTPDRALLADYLIVDATRPYAADSFFEIEQATLDGRTHQTCGGRSLNDDVIDKLLTAR